MSAIRLYHPAAIEISQTVTLSKETSHHLVRVMRARKGDEVFLFNGDGLEYKAKLLDENLKACSLTINEKIQGNRESPLHITLIQGISRSDRMDTCLQKSTELGVNAIIPVFCEKSTTKLKADRAEKKLNHWKQVIISASEQSGRCILPELHDIMPLSQALEQARDSLNLVLDPESGTGLTSFNNSNENIFILVGPEGGLTQGEIQLAHDKNFKGTGLGPRILRTETAGPACIAAIQTLWGDLGS